MLRSPILLALAAIASAATPATARAQQPTILAPGAVVRWHHAPTGGRQLEALVTGATSDSLFLQVAGGSAYRIAAANPDIEVRGDRHSRGRKALVGTAIGAGVGLVVGLAARSSGCDAYYGCGYESDGRYVGASIVGGALWGVLIGALLTPSWQWHPLNGAATVSIRPVLTWQGRPVIGVSMGRQ